MLALIDADLLVYRIGFTTLDVDEGIMRARLRESVNLILEATRAVAYKMYLTADNDQTAFRKQLYPEYKANRVAPRPKFYNEIRQLLVDTYDAEIVSGIEADDALGIHQTRELKGQDAFAVPGLQTSVIVSIDKDLHQIAGCHYNFVKQQFADVTVEEALRYFYTQLLTGDSADNIKGVWKCGPVKAAKILEGLDDVYDMFAAVRDAYGNDEEMLLNGRCLWIFKKPDDDWLNHWEHLVMASEQNKIYAEPA